jgi:hypothetical protein
VYGISGIWLQQLRTPLRDSNSTHFARFTTLCYSLATLEVDGHLARCAIASILIALSQLLEDIELTHELLKLRSTQRRL